MTRDEIKAIIPHREPMLLVDEAEIVDGEVTSHYTIRENEFFTTGHFPGYPIVPGVILCEIIAQGSFLLIPADELEDHLAVYAGLDDVRFKTSVFPGDTVETRSHLIGRKGPLVVIDAKATVNGKLCCKGTLKFMLVPKEKL